MKEGNESLIEVVLEGSPKDRPWEGCINSVNYRVPRGITVRVPAFLAEHINRTEAERAAAERAAQAYSEKIRRL